jgi:hypothetical protein
MIALIIGIIVVVLGVVGIVQWFSDFVSVLKGAVPPMFVCGGLLAIIAGITSIKDAAEAKKLEEERKKEEEKKKEGEQK